MKPSVRRARTTTGHLAHGWILTRPPYGFGTTEITRHASWREAHSALATQPATTPPANAVQVAGYLTGLRGPAGRVWTRPRWIDT